MTPPALCLIAVNADGDGVDLSENKMIGQLQRKGRIAAGMTVEIHTVDKNDRIAVNAFKLDKNSLSFPCRIGRELFSIPDEIGNVLRIGTVFRVVFVIVRIGICAGIGIGLSAALQ